MITTKIRFFFALLSVLIIALSTCLWFVFQKESVLSSLEKNRFEFYGVVNLQKKNILDFSTYVNKYINRDEQQNKEAFLRFIQIDTNTDLIKQRNYALNELNYFFQEVDKKKIKEIQNFLKEIKFSKTMFKKIFKVNDFAKDILALDIEALNIYEGFYKNDNGLYIIKTEKNKSKAQSILNTYKYQILKEELILNADEILDYITIFMDEYIQKQKEEQSKLYIISFFVLCCIIGLIIVGMAYSHNYLLKSLELLVSWTQEVENGNYSFNHVKCKKTKTPKKDEISLLMNSFSSMAQAIKNNIYNLERLTVTDTLTNLYNRRGLNEALQNEFHKFERYKTPCSIIILDIDYFKSVNDTYGHDIGDIVLQEFAVVVGENIRNCDTLGRWGGEEFLIICPNTNLENVRKLAEILRAKVEAFDFTKVGNKTASFGTVEFVENKSIDDIIIQSDQALYKAKATGRNCVI